MKFLTILSLLFCLSGTANATNELSVQDHITAVYHYDEQPCDSIVDKKSERQELRKQRRLKRKKNRPQRDYVVLDILSSFVGEILFQILIEEIIFGG